MIFLSNNKCAHECNEQDDRCDRFHFVLLLKFSLVIGLDEVGVARQLILILYGSCDVLASFTNEKKSEDARRTWCAWSGDFQRT